MIPFKEFITEKQAPNLAADFEKQFKKGKTIDVKTVLKKAGVDLEGDHFVYDGVKLTPKGGELQITFDDVQYNDEAHGNVHLGDMKITMSQSGKLKVKK